MQATDFDRFIGIEVYTTKTPGIGGRLRFQPEDFIVQEIGIDGDVAPLKPVSRQYPEQSGKFLAFFLVKRNIDTIQAIRQVSRAMGISYKRFSYAGIKDRRALTSQRVTLYKGEHQDLLGREIPNIQLLHPHRVRRPLLPGELLGNHFSIIVRDLEVSPNEIANRVKKIEKEYERKGGILNFFGHQRFGVIQPTTHLIGEQILKGDLQEAIRILLDVGHADDSTPDEEPEGEETIDQKQKSPRGQTGYGTFERAISNYLNKHPGDYSGSFNVLPKDLVRLYIHAYQAFLFNKALSQRALQGISLSQPIIGDFTLPTTGEVYGARMITRATLSHAKKEIQKGHLKLAIPIIGYDLEHFEFKGRMGEILTKILEEEQITPSQFRLKHLSTYSSRGTFRPILIRPANFQFNILDEEPEVAVKINFNLGKGSYASIVFREFMKPENAARL